MQVDAGQLGIFTDTFKTIHGTFFWEYQLASLIWGIGHLLSKSQTGKIPKAKYMQLNISMNEARAKADFLRTQMLQKGCTITPSEFQAILDELTQVWHISGVRKIYSESWQKKEINLCPCLQQVYLTQTAPDFEAQNNQKLCLSFCHSLVSHLTSFFWAIYCI